MLMGLRSYILKRAINSLIVLFFVLTLNFLIFEAMPGNPMESLLISSRNLTGAQVEEIFRLYGLRRPLHEKYTIYLHNMLTWQFGYSFHSAFPISEQIGMRLLNTLLLMGGSTVIALIIGVILGVIAAHKRGGLFDSASVVTALTTYSLPSFWIGMMLIVIFSYNLRWFPMGGSIPREWAFNWPEPLATVNILGTHISIPSLTEILGRLRHVFMPITTLTLFFYGGYLLLTRATMLEALTEDYVVTARAKGLKERTVLFKHALKNASLPIITNAAISFGFLLSGAIISEQVFSYPGLGQWLWGAIDQKDYAILQAMFYIIALCVIIANFIADILYGVMDPRIKYG